MADYPPYYQTSKPMDVEHYFRLMVRQKWFILAPALLGLICAGAGSLLLQNQYSARATILVERATLPTEFLRPTLPVGPETYVRSLVEQIKSTSSLEKIIREFNLYPELRKRKAIEEVVAYMRGKIIIENKANDTFSVQFQGESPEVVAKVTNRLTDMFIEENLKYRLARSTDNVTFLERESQRLRAQVALQEQQIQEFKSANIESLPEQRNSTQLQLSAAQQRLQSIAESIASARNRADSARDRIALLRELGQSERPGATLLSPQDQLQEALQKERLTLESLLTRYSEKHPDVRRQVKEVEQLEARLATLPRTGPARGPKVVRSPELLHAQEEERLALTEVTRLEAERKRLEGLISTLSLRLEDTPRVALALQQLEQGMEVKREQADSWQKKATEATASLELERQNQGSQFRALDRAQLPTRPDSPNRPFIALLGAGLGFALGIGLVIGLDLLFRPFLDDNDLYRFTKVPVLISIPQHGPFPSDLMRLRRQLANLMSLLLGALPGGERLTYAGSNLNLPPRTRHALPSEDMAEEEIGAAPQAKKSTYLTGEVSEIDPELGAAVLIQASRERPAAAAEPPWSSRSRSVGGADARRPGVSTVLRSGQIGEDAYARPPSQELPPFTGPGLITPPPQGLSRGRPALPPLPDVSEGEQDALPLSEPRPVSTPARAASLTDPGAGALEQVRQDQGEGASDESPLNGAPVPLAVDKRGDDTPWPLSMGGTLEPDLRDGISRPPGIPALDLGRMQAGEREARRSAQLPRPAGDASPIPGFGPAPTHLKTLADRAARALLTPDEEAAELSRRAVPSQVPQGHGELERDADLTRPERAVASSESSSLPPDGRATDGQGREERLELPPGWGLPKNWVVGPAWRFTGKEDAHGVTDGMAALRELELTPPWVEVEQYTRPSSHQAEPRPSPSGQ